MVFPILAIAALGFFILNSFFQEIIAGLFLGFMIAVLIHLLVRNNVTSLIIVGGVASIWSGYKFYLQPLFPNFFPLIPEFMLAVFAGFTISKGILLITRFFGLTP